jgi:Fe-S cluster assembly protein SufD
MEYINNIYDYKEVEIIARSYLKTYRAVVAQGLTLRVTNYPDKPWLTTAQFERTKPGINHEVKVKVTARDNSILELHICNLINDEDTIKYDIDVTVGSNCDVTLSTVSVYGRKAEVNININITGENSHVKLPGLLLPFEDERFTYHSNIVHSAGLSTTVQKVRTVAAENGFGSFFGIIKVESGAQKSVTEQVNNNILLSENARIESRPQLEIYADDVKCSHGSTTGMLDSEAVFYMRSRGISEKTAQNLLLQAFVDEIVDTISIDDDYKVFVKDVIADKIY